MLQIIDHPFLNRKMAANFFNEILKKIGLLKQQQQPSNDSTPDLQMSFAGIIELRDDDFKKVAEHNGNAHVCTNEEAIKKCDIKPFTVFNKLMIDLHNSKKKILFERLVYVAIQKFVFVDIFLKETLQTLIQTYSCNRLQSLQHVAQSITMALLYFLNNYHFITKKTRRKINTIV